MRSIEAYLDDYNKITVEVSNEYYGGHCDYFTILNQDNKIISYKLNDKIKKQNSYSYDLVLEDECSVEEEYTVLSNNGYRATIVCRGIVMTSRFEVEYTYDGNDLGATVDHEQTTFKCWAPTSSKMSCLLGDQIVPMIKGEKGVFSCVVDRNCHGEKYVYLIKTAHEYRETIDPYGKSSDCNGKSSVVIDFKKICNQAITHIHLNKPTDAIIYECSIRDMTMSNHTNTKEYGTYNAFCERGTKYNNYTTGFDHVVEMGVTHVQIMPVCDFVTVEESNPKLNYNWGYDPSQYMTLEGSYSSDAHNGVTRCSEFMNLVQNYHDENIGVIMDVVFNHHYDYRLSALNKCVPYYYFRFHSGFVPSNGSFCGNDIESRRSMVRKYIVDSCVFFSKVYGVDGFRFDLMGILDVDTMNEIHTQVSKINPSVLLYGEGWNMPTALKNSEKAMIDNSYAMPHIGQFNDMFRDVLKGKAHDQTNYGFVNGNPWLRNEMIYCMGDRKNTEFSTGFDIPSHVFNYAECHDNCTLWDKLVSSNPLESEEIRVKKQKLAIGLLMVAQGIPFIQSGQEFCRSKSGFDNTYNMSDSINEIDWTRKEKYLDVVNYTKECIELRKEVELFRLGTKEECIEIVHVKFENDLLIYTLQGEETLVVLANAFDHDIHVSYPDYECIFNESGKCSESAEEMSVKRNSMVVLKYKKSE